MDLNQLAMDAKNDNEMRNSFIANNSNFIIHCAHKTTYKYITKSDDEWSVALIAFSQAIDSYQIEKGYFLNYAKVIIQNSLTDYHRKQVKYLKEIKTDPEIFGKDVEKEDSFEKSISKKLIGIDDTGYKDEIEALNQILTKYHFTFFDLIQVSPKQKKTRKECAKVVLILLKDESLKKDIRQKGTLPMQEMEKKSGVPRKLMERNRKYIMTVLEIIDGDFPLLAEYLTDIRKEMPK